MYTFARWQHGNAQKVADIISDNNNNKTFFFVAAIGRRFLSYLLRYECVTNLGFFDYLFDMFLHRILRAEDRMKCVAHQQRPVTSSHGCCNRRGVCIEIALPGCQKVLPIAIHFCILERERRKLPFTDTTRIQRKKS